MMENKAIYKAVLGMIDLTSLNTVSYTHLDVYKRQPGRRSRKREAQFLETLQDEVNALAAAATIFWDKPLGAARRG